MNIIRRIAINALLVGTTCVVVDAIYAGIEKIKEAKKSKENK